MAAPPISRSLGRDRDLTFYVRVVAAIIFNLARLLDDCLAGRVRPQLHVPVAVPSGGSMDDEITVHPFDRVTDMSRDCRGGEGEVLRLDPDRLGQSAAPSGRRGRKQHSDGSQRPPLAPPHFKALVTCSACCSWPWKIF